MAKKRTKKGPPPQAMEWLERFKRGERMTRQPTKAHQDSIWRTSFIPLRFVSASNRKIERVEGRLSIAIPSSLRRQLLIQNGGYLVKLATNPFPKAGHWTNATVDGILPIEEWETVALEPWAQRIKQPEQVVSIASHSESYLCLDYRERGVPSVLLVEDLGKRLVKKLLGSAEDFVRLLVENRAPDADHDD